MEEVPTLTFLVSSRITFVLVRFFDLVGKASHQDILQKIELPCREIENLLRDWHRKLPTTCYRLYEEWLQKSQDNDIDSWILVDVTLTRYTTIMFMVRKCNLLESSSPISVSSDRDVPHSPLAVNASRNILNIINRLPVRVPSSETLSIIVSFFRAFIPNSFLASNIMRSSNPSALRPDLEFLERIPYGTQRDSCK
ncbi:hypothetical protein EDB80DRAFT_880338 [Ilyonectria destructans]|nr:hypothetical protein EDB80DRAFT_880338 [Ilyonectria destructans]